MNNGTVNTSTDAGGHIGIIVDSGNTASTFPAGGAAAAAAATASSPMMQPPASNTSAGGGLADHNLFIAGLPPGTDDDKLAAMFTRFGTIVSARVLVDLATQALRNYGFVKFSTHEAAARAIEEMNETRVQPHQVMHVTWATHREEASECDTLYVRNLPDTITRHDLAAFFGRFGDIRELSLPKCAPFRGVCFVRYRTIEEARAALAVAHNSAPFGPRALQVRFKAPSKKSSAAAGNADGTTTSATATGGGGNLKSQSINASGSGSSMSALNVGSFGSAGDANQQQLQPLPGLQLLPSPLGSSNESPFTVSAAFDRSGVLSTDGGGGASGGSPSLLPVPGFQNRRASLGALGAPSTGRTHSSSSSVADGDALRVTPTSAGAGSGVTVATAQQQQQQQGGGEAQMMNAPPYSATVPGLAPTLAPVQVQPPQYLAALPPQPMQMQQPHLQVVRAVQLPNGQTVLVAQQQPVAAAPAAPQMFAQPMPVGPPPPHHQHQQQLLVGHHPGYYGNNHSGGYRPGAELGYIAHQNAAVFAQQQQLQQQQQQLLQQSFPAAGDLCFVNVQDDNELLNVLMRCFGQVAMFHRTAEGLCIVRLFNALQHDFCARQLNGQPLAPGAPPLTVGLIGVQQR